jgi:putative peptidoglycan lipid II flippase
MLGASAPLDIYYAAFRIPDFLYVTVASLAAVTALLPFLNKKIAENKHLQESEIFASAKVFFSGVFTSYLVIMVIISVILFIIMPWLAPFVVPGFSQEQIVELVKLSRNMLLSPIFMGLSNLFSSVTQMFQRFLVYALSPVLYNVGILFGVLVLYPKFGLTGIAYGVVGGALLHGLIQLPVLIQHNFLPRITFRIIWKDIKDLVQLSLPRTLGLATTNISMLILVAFASLIGAGAISVFQFSYNLQNVPLILIGLSYSVAAFPTLSRLYAENNIEQYIAEIERAAKQIIFWSIPAVFLFIVLRAQIVRVILGSGMFSWSDTRLTAAAVAIFSLSVVAQCLILLMIRGYYAAGKTSRPLVINIVTTAVTIAFGYIFLQIFNHYHQVQYFIESLLRVEYLNNTAILMLPLAFSLGLIINFIWLWQAFKKDFRPLHARSLNRAFFQSFAASFMMGTASYQCLIFFGNMFNLNTFWGVFLQGFISGIIGVFVLVGVLYLMKNEQLQELARAFKSKFWKAPVIQEGQGDL